MGSPLGHGDAAVFLLAPHDRCATSCRCRELVCTASTRGERMSPCSCSPNHAAHASHACALVACASDLVQVIKSMTALLAVGRLDIWQRVSNGFGQRGLAASARPVAVAFGLRSSCARCMCRLSSWIYHGMAWIYGSHGLQGARVLACCIDAALGHWLRAWQARARALRPGFDVLLLASHCLSLILNGASMHQHARIKSCSTWPQRALRLAHSGEGVVEQLWWPWGAWYSQLWLMA